MSSADVTSPVSQPGVGWALACTRRGASHRLSAQRCQDAHCVWSASYAGSAGVVLTVADGHGDTRHDLSHVGAALATQVATIELAAVFSQLKMAEPKPPSSFSLTKVFRGGEARGGLFRRVHSDFPLRVVRRWKEVVQDYEQEPGRDPKSKASAAPEFVRYGTTLLSALVTDEAVLFAQLGDGDILWVSDNGDVEVLFPPEQAKTNITASLCSDNAEHLMEVGWRPRLERGVLLLATDGLTNAFNNKASLVDYVRSLGERIRTYSPEVVAQALPDWLDVCSRAGSGDDITIALARLDTPPLDRLQKRRESLDQEHVELLSKQKEERAKLVATHQELLIQLEEKTKAYAAKRDQARRQQQEEVTRLEQDQKRQLEQVRNRQDELESEIANIQKALESVPRK